MFKVGDKVTRIWNDNVDVKQGKTYTIKKQHRFGVSLEETGEALYSTQGFKLVEDDMKIKITKIEELNNKGNDKYYLIVFKEREDCNIQISRKTKNWFIIIRKADEIKKEELISLLAHFGFDIEVVEPIKLTKEEWHFVRAFKDGWVIRNEGAPSATFVNMFPTKLCDKKEWIIEQQRGHRTRCYELPKEMFPHITWDTEPWSIESLRELECEEEIV